MNRNAVDQILDIQLLGGFTVRVGETVLPEEAWHLKRARSLIKLLALAPAHRLHREQVIDTLWPDSDLGSATNNLYQTLFAARRVLEGANLDCLVLEEGMISLAGCLATDVEAFEAAAQKALKSQDPSDFHAALDLYHGDLLPDDLYEEWTLSRREALRQTRLQLLLGLAQLYEKRQDNLSGIATLQKVLAIDRANEDAHAGLMRLYALSGQRQQALRQYQALREALQAELGVEPSDGIRRLFDEIRTGKVTLAIPSEKEIPARRHNLPAQLTSFIGREKQIAHVTHLVRDHRLVTLIGAGGTGKTRLALQVASGLVDDFADGVCLVELAPLSEPQLLPQVVIQALELVQQSDVSLTDLLARYLEHRQLLLILDNAEHLIEACAQLVDRLLKACPKLSILATSREVLTLASEVPYRVPSLAVPDPTSDPSIEALSEVESVRLFLERAAQVVPGLALTPSNAAAVVQICRRLDGIPLAIELAASRARAMSAEQIASRLGDAFHLLTGGSRADLPRHQTLKAAFDWSYDLLSHKERRLLQRLSVFAGGWTLEAAEVVGADGENALSDQAIRPGEVLDLLTRLVDKSLVQAEPRLGQERYSMLEIVRQYAHQRLLETGEDQAVRERHLACFAALTAQAEKHLRGESQVEWLDRLEDELGNMRAALEGSLGGDVERGLQIMADSMWFWWIRGLFYEGAGWLQTLLAAEMVERGEAPLQANRALQRARGLRTLNYLSQHLNIFPEAQRVQLINESIAILRRLGPDGRRELGISLLEKTGTKFGYNLSSLEEQEMSAIFQQYHDRFYLSEYISSKYAWAYLYYSDIDRVKTLAQESMAISREIGDLDGISSRLTFQGTCALWDGNYAQAEALYREALEYSQKVRNRWWVLVIYERQNSVKMAQGQYVEALRYSEMVQKRYQEFDYRPGISDMLLQRMAIAWAMGDYPLAWQLGCDVIEKNPEDFSRKVEAHSWLSRVAMAEGHLEQAEVQLSQARYDKSFGIRPGTGAALLQSWIWLFHKQGKLGLAARLQAAIENLSRFGGQALREREEHDRCLAEMRAALGEEAFAAAWQAGQALTLEQALEEACASLT